MQALNLSWAAPQAKAASTNVSLPPEGCLNQPVEFASFVGSNPLALATKAVTLELEKARMTQLEEEAAQLPRAAGTKPNITFALENCDTCSS